MTSKELKLRIELFINELKKEEKKISDNQVFCQKHNFKKEAEWLSSQRNMITEIRMEAELILESRDYRPKLYFNQ